MSFVTGFAQGFSESVQAAIEEEQKSMDDLFKTQFTVRLKRRMDDLSKDRENLAEAAKNLETYRQLLPDNDLFKAGQLYKAAGGDHTAYIKRITDIRNAGGDPFAQLQFTEGDLGEATAQDVARSLVVAPTALPFSEMPSAGGLLGALAKQFGADAQHSPYARKQMERLQGRLQAVAPLPEAGQQFDIPSVTQTGSMLTPTERLTQEDLKTRVEQNRRNLQFFNSMFDYKVGTAKTQMEGAILGTDLLKRSVDDRVAHFKNTRRISDLEVKSKTFGVENLLELQQKEANLKIDLLGEQINKIKNPTDLEEMKAVLLHQQFKVENQLKNTSLDNVPETQRLESIQNNLVRKNIRIDYEIARMQAVKATPADPLKHLSPLNSAYGSALKTAVNASTLAGNENVIINDMGENGVSVAFKGDPKGDGLKVFNHVVTTAKKNFFFAFADGINQNGDVQFASPAAERIIQLNLGTGDFKKIQDYYKISQDYNLPNRSTSENVTSFLKAVYNPVKFKSVENEEVETNKKRIMLLDRLTHVFDLKPYQAKEQLKAYEDSVKKQAAQSGVSVN